ncbi:MAG TPA: cyclic nucleotide-binding domain-containing protein [Burkholderiales bacterium]|nr:cyclic nucleotide-binding domain-containing protein [Burkholderiales bacterium]
MPESATRGGNQEAALKLELVRNSALAVELTGDQCAVLAELVSVRKLADGEVLVRQGASDNHLYAIVSGALAVARQVEADGQWVNLHLLGKGDLAGELGFMDGRPHYAALRATGPTQVLCLEREKLESLLQREPVVVYRVMRAIFRVVHVIVNRMAMQTSELTNYIFKVHGKY